LKRADYQGSQEESLKKQEQIYKNKVPISYKIVAAEKENQIIQEGTQGCYHY